VIGGSIRAVAAVAADLLREALSRRWFVAIGAGITLVLATIALAVRLEVVDGALAATRLFGADLAGDVRAVDVALRPVFAAAAWLVFHGGICFGILACADVAPSLLAPGRIEHLLSLPLRRWELLAGTWLGVMGLACVGALYGAGGLAAILGAKTGVWTARPLAAALLAAAGFAPIYAAMLAAAVLARSAALSAAVGGGLFVAGLVAGNRDVLLALFDPGPSQAIFAAITMVLPRLSALAEAAHAIAGSERVAPGALAALLGGHLAFALATLALAIWRFERKDY